MEQKIIPFETHGLPLDKIDSHALYIMEKLKAEGFVAYLVGGSVRDLLLGHRPKDFDISTSARPEDIKKIFRNCLLIGRRFRLAHIRFGKKIIEVATFRSGDPDKEELILRDNQWGYPEEDAFRRDFTINGLFYDPSNQTIIDYVGGFEDIEKKLLRSIGQPYIRFRQDPVRMLRLLKFQARFGLNIDPEALVALVECREEIVKSSPARVLEEMLRMMESGASRAFFELLVQHGLLGHLLPQLAKFLDGEKEGAEIYSFLQEVDTIFKDPQAENLERPVLLSAVAYPLLNKRIDVHFLQREAIPHLGQIQAHTRSLLSELFEGFLLLPRRLKISMHNILLGQFRLTPLSTKRKSKKRVPQGSEFHLALKFLCLRSCLEPGLQTVYDEWHEVYRNSEIEEPIKRKRRPRRRKRVKKE